MELRGRALRGLQQRGSARAAGGAVINLTGAGPWRRCGLAGRTLGNALASVLLLAALAAGVHALEWCPNGKYCPDGYVCCFIGGEYLC